jgi:hypothetical protein
MPVSGILLAATATLCATCATCVTAVVLLAMVLRFARTMVDMNHGDTKCLRDVAVLLRAMWGAPRGLLAALARMISRR